VHLLDPLLAVLEMQRQGRAQWGALGFDEGGYTAAKLAALPQPLPKSFKGSPLAIALPRDRKVLLFACAVNSYGEVSRPVPIALKVPEEAPAVQPAEGQGTEPEPTAPGTTPAEPDAEGGKPGAAEPGAPAAGPAKAGAAEPAEGR
jgi:hypothetical protein